MLLKRYCWHDVKVQKGPLCSPPLVSSRREASSRNYRFRYSEPTNAFARNNKAGSPSAFAICTLDLLDIIAALKALELGLSRHGTARTQWGCGAEDGIRMLQTAW
ncbi:hypothetical protein KC338_g18 [Hortaea werneckii]|nr:hypothetical protein KC338_g18 [Hortaea werneckii]